MIIIPDNTCANGSIFCAKDTGTASVRYFGEIHLATLKLVSAAIMTMPLGLITYQIINLRATKGVVATAYGFSISHFFAFGIKF